RNPAGFAKGGLSFVGRIFQHIPDGLVIPVHFAGLCANTSLLKTTTDLIDRTALLPNPGKHLLHDASFIKDDIKASFSSSLVLVHIPVSVGSVAENANASLLCGMTLSSTTPFEEFGS